MTASPRTGHRRGHRRPGFTLVEIMIVVALMGVALALAGAGLTAWRIRSDVQRTVSGVVGVLRRAASQTQSRKQPYRLVLGTGPQGRQLTGSRWQLSSDSTKSTFVPDLAVDISPYIGAIALRAPDSEKNWIVSDGATFLEVGPASADFWVNLPTDGGGKTGYSVTLRRTGQVVVNCGVATE